MLKCKVKRKQVMERRLLFAVVLSILVMLIYPLFIAKVSPPPEESVLDTQLVEQQEVVEIPQTEVRAKEIKIELPDQAISRNLTNDRYEIELSNIGGSIQKIRINDSEKLDIDLVKDAIYSAGILSMEGEGAFADMSSQPFEMKGVRGTFVIEKDGLLIEKEIRFLKDKYALTATIKITNNTLSTKKLSFDLTTASNISDKEVFESRYIEASVLDQAGKLKKFAGRNLKKYNKLYGSDLVWLALKNKYYSIIAKPDFTPAGIFTKKINDTSAIGFIVDDKIFPGETKDLNILFYIGPTDGHELEKAEPSFNRALNFGFFTSIALVLLSILNFFYSICHNYGFSIILLTCCVSFLLFPLTLKSLKSMKKLQELQPHIEKIRTEHKGNPTKLNKEVMELYRRYNVNPMGGCFPMFLQMPIFISLYQTLMRSVELKGATFLWIKDLSMPDAAFTLPFTLPFLGSTINLLPILMIGAMIVQQKSSQARSQAGQTDQQKMMAAVMPIVFGFIFYSLPSGLVLYWLTNTLLTTTLQSLFLHKK